MIELQLDYTAPSTVQAGGGRSLLGLSADARRPVRFHARVRRDVLSVRLALQALGAVIWSDYSAAASFLLDPVVTVHPDRVFFEAFSQDQSVYGLVTVDRGLFEPEGEVVCGTTNVDFTAWLWSALAEMRSSRETWFRIEARGLEVQTHGAGSHFERKVDLPEEWVRGFLQLQEAMALPGTRLGARPVDLLAAVRFLRYTRARVSPRALRYEFEPGQEARIVLEPWEEVIRLRGTEHNYQERRVIRTWGRRRLELLEPVLPYADGLHIYLKGRALPSFYAVKLPGVTFLLGLSGWSENRWTGTGSFDLLTARVGTDRALLPQALDLVRDRCTVSAADLAEALGVGRDVATRLLARLCRQGRVIYDVESRLYRHRELFAEPPDEGRLFPPDPRQEEAWDLLRRRAVHVGSCRPRETRKVRKLRTPAGPVEKEVVYREWQVTGAAGDQPEVEAVVNDAGRLIFGTCGCPFFRDNLLNQGPCAHLIALLQASEPSRGEQPPLGGAGYGPRQGGGR
jgi:hypothetical protein